jgi:hypothetical protein
VQAEDCIAAALKKGGFGSLTGNAPWIHREGILWHEPSPCDLLFLTLNKSEALFSPSTRYRDLALGPSRRGGCRGWGWRFEGAVITDARAKADHFRNGDSSIA